MMKISAFASLAFLFLSGCGNSSMHNARWYDYEATKSKTAPRNDIELAASINKCEASVNKVAASSSVKPFLYIKTDESLYRKQKYLSCSDFRDSKKDTPDGLCNGPNYQEIYSSCMGNEGCGVKRDVNYGAMIFGGQ